MRRFFPSDWYVTTPALVAYFFAAMYGFSIAAATELEAPLPKTERIVYAPKASLAWCKGSPVQCLVMEYLDFDLD